MPMICSLIGAHPMQQHPCTRNDSAGLPRTHWIELNRCNWTTQINNCMSRYKWLRLHIRYFTDDKLAFYLDSNRFHLRCYCACCFGRFWSWSSATLFMVIGAHAKAEIREDCSVERTLHVVGACWQGDALAPQESFLIQTEFILRKNARRLICFSVLNFRMDLDLTLCQLRR